MTSSIWAILPAAGSGRRMGSQIPKQYLDLNDEPVIAHSLQKLANIPAIRKIVVVLHPEDQYFSSLKLTNIDKIITTQGGAERFQSVLNGLSHLTGIASDDDWVLVHDAVRPCVRVTDIQHLIDQLSHHSVGGLLGFPVVDTLKQVNDKGEVVQTVDRSRYWHAQTPQMFRFNVLGRALRAAAAQSLDVTDEAGAIEHLGLRPQMITGHRDNIKITHAADLGMASNILAAQANMS